MLCRGGENRERLLLARLSSSDGAGGQKRIILDILELSMESKGRGRVETLRPLRPSTREAHHGTASTTLASRTDPAQSGQSGRFFCFAIEPYVKGNHSQQEKVTNTDSNISFQKARSSSFSTLLSLPITLRRSPAIISWQVSWTLGHRCRSMVILMVHWS